MLSDLWTEVRGLLAAGGLVAVVAGSAAAVAGRYRRGPVLPPWKPWRVPWGGLEVAAAFFVLIVVVPDVMALVLDWLSPVAGTNDPGGAPPFEPLAAVAGATVAAADAYERETAAVVRQLWVGLIALPIQLGLVRLVRRTQYPDWPSPLPPPLANRVLLAVRAWAVLTPAVLGLNLLVNLVFSLFDVTPDAHELTRLAGRPAPEAALLVVQACVTAPLLEEVLFRGILLPWLLGGHWPGRRRDRYTAARPAVVAGLGVATAVLTGRPGPIAFSVLLAGGLALTYLLKRSWRRTAGAVYASAALFAAVHSAVWPSPVPLFILGLALGGLAVRTRGVLVPTLVHGLFNAVSVVFILLFSGG